MLENAGLTPPTRAVKAASDGRATSSSVQSAVVRICHRFCSPSRALKHVISPRLFRNTRSRPREWRGFDNSFDVSGNRRREIGGTTFTARMS